MGGIFLDPGQAAVRGGRVDLLDPDAPRHLVRDGAVCQTVVRAAVARMREGNVIWGQGEEGPFEALVFRFGPYYAVVLTSTAEAPDPVDPNVLSVATGHSPVVILRVRDLSHLHTVYM